MPAKKYLSNNNGVLTEVVASQTSAGAADGGKIVALDDQGKLDNSMMPVGIGADTAIVVTSEALSAGDWINIWNSSGAKARKADAASAKECHGFVLAAVTSGGNATVYFEGTNNMVNTQTPGQVFLGNAGVGVSAAPTAAGSMVQRIGIAVSDTAVNFERSQPIVLA
jgi:hypothetical protein